ncbi:Mu transposase domain-containing protein, partial [Gordonia sp. DT219]|uniref:Mu transposase domain-containing protein n=1 Tax=Gordonia sp. DT219 TaxID=3416658 RepID=UPI003CF7EF31
SAIGRYVDIAASADEVVISCQQHVIGVHQRCWDTARTITDPEHVAAAKVLRRTYTQNQRARHEAAAAGRLLPAEAGLVRDPGSYDALFGIDFDPDPATRAATDGQVA